MKKLLLIIVVVAMAVLAGCSSAVSSFKEGYEAAAKSSEEAASPIPAVEPTQSASPAPTPEPTPVPTPEPTPATVNVDEAVLFDQEGVKLTLISLADELFGPELKVLVENESDVPVTVQVRDCSVNGYMLESIIFSSEVAPGKKRNDGITFMSATLENNGIDAIGTVELTFHVFNSETWDTIFDTETITIKTSAANNVTNSAPETKIVAFEKDGILISFVDFNTDAFWGLDIKFYIENNSDTPITVQTRNTSINGFMIDGMMSCDVLPGKVANTTLSFFDSNIKENGIESIDSVELKFHIFNKDTWDTIIDTDVIELKK